MSDPLHQSPVKQKHWRITGLASLGVCALMAFTATEWPFLRESLLWFTLYWLGFLLALLVTFYCVLLDIRYIRASFALERRDIFNETLGDPEFRESLKAAQKKAMKKKPASTNGSRN
ncbi:MAG: hypothetical protein AMXMBFR84_45620 [Candidatus Hydrogenedentota bacterium]